MFIKKNGQYDIKWYGKNCMHINDFGPRFCAVTNQPMIAFSQQI
jgi:hypothetical protein